MKIFSALGFLTALTAVSAGRNAQVDQQISDFLEAQQAQFNDGSDRRLSSMDGLIRPDRRNLPSCCKQVCSGGGGKKSGGGKKAGGGKKGGCQDDCSGCSPGYPDLPGPGFPCPGKPAPVPIMLVIIGFVPAEDFPGILPCPDGNPPYFHWGGKKGIMPMPFPPGGKKGGPVPSGGKKNSSPSPKSGGSPSPKSGGSPSPKSGGSPSPKSGGGKGNSPSPKSGATSPSPESGGAESPSPTSGGKTTPSPNTGGATAPSPVTDPAPPSGSGSGISVTEYGSFINYSCNALKDKPVGYLAASMQTYTSDAHICLEEGYEDKFDSMSSALLTGAITPGLVVKILDCSADEDYEFAVVSLDRTQLGDYAMNETKDDGSSCGSWTGWGFTITHYEKQSKSDNRRRLQNMDVLALLFAALSQVLNDINPDLYPGLIGSPLLQAFGLADESADSGALGEGGTAVVAGLSNDEATTQLQESSPNVGGIVGITLAVMALMVIALVAVRKHRNASTYPDEVELSEGTPEFQEDCDISETSSGEQRTVSPLSDTAYENEHGANTYGNEHRANIDSHEADGNASTKTPDPKGCCGTDMCFG